MAEPVWIEWTEPIGYIHAMAAFPEEPCGVCSQLTAWVDFDFQCRLCPHPCSEIMWLDYETALRTPST
jgi:hypothetical protein